MLGVGATNSTTPNRGVFRTRAVSDSDRKAHRPFLAKSFSKDIASSVWNPAEENVPPGAQFVAAQPSRNQLFGVLQSRNRNSTAGSTPAAFGKHVFKPVAEFTPVVGKPNFAVSPVQFEAALDEPPFVGPSVVTSRRANTSSETKPAPVVVARQQSPMNVWQQLLWTLWLIMSSRFVKYTAVTYVVLQYFLFYALVATGIAAVGVAVYASLPRNREASWLFAQQLWYKLRS